MGEVSLEWWSPNHVRYLVPLESSASASDCLALTYARLRVKDNCLAAFKERAALKDEDCLPVACCEDMRVSSLYLGDPEQIMLSARPFVMYLDTSHPNQTDKPTTVRGKNCTYRQNCRRKTERP